MSHSEVWRCDCRKPGTAMAFDIFSTTKLSPGDIVIYGGPINGDFAVIQACEDSATIRGRRNSSFVFIDAVCQAMMPNGVIENEYGKAIVYSWSPPGCAIEAVFWLKGHPHLHFARKEEVLEKMRAAYNMQFFDRVESQLKG